MGYCTPNDPTEEPLHSWITCPECEGEGYVYVHDGEDVCCPECNGDGEVIFEQE